MRVYTVVLQVEAEDEGMNGSYPNPKRIREYVLKGLPMGHQSERGIPVKVKALKCLSVSRGEKGFIR
jgi:hypothetical protein